MLCQLNEDGILTDALDHMPRDDQVILLPPPEDTAASRDHQGEDARILAIKLKVACISEPRSVAEIDDLEPT